MRRRRARRDMRRMFACEAAFLLFWYLFYALLMPFSAFYIRRCACHDMRKMRAMRAHKIWYFCRAAAAAAIRRLFSASRRRRFFTQKDIFAYARSFHLLCFLMRGDEARLPPSSPSRRYAPRAARHASLRKKIFSATFSPPLFIKIPPRRPPPPPPRACSSGTLHFLLRVLTLSLRRRFSRYVAEYILPFAFFMPKIEICVARRGRCRCHDTRRRCAARLQMSQKFIYMR